MRNEHHGSWMSSLVMGCEPTYENGNSQSSSVQKVPKGCELPMRMENAHKNLRLSPSRPVASLPMRNGNGEQRNNTLILAPLRAYLWEWKPRDFASQERYAGCEPTYEEWKHVYPLSEGSPLPRCEPTYRNGNYNRARKSKGDARLATYYEEWKLRTYIRRAGANSCEPTYEEWKPTNRLIAW